MVSNKENDKMVDGIIDPNEPIESIRSILVRLRKCATGETFPFWDKEEIPDLIIQEIDDILNILRERELHN